MHDTLDAPSSMLDNVTTESHTCQSSRAELTVDRETGEVIGFADVSAMCDAPAVAEHIITCCDGRVRYRCADHVDPFARYGATTCTVCLHRCVQGVCCHRIVNPL